MPEDSQLSNDIPTDSPVPEIVLIYADDCPHVDQARAQLRLALEGAGRTPVWTEWNREDADAPALSRTFGSPTILVHGKDVDPGPGRAADANCCRLYPAGDGALEGFPRAERVLAALERGGG